MTRIRVNRIYLYFQYPLLPPGVLSFRRDLPATCDNFRKPIFPIPPTPLASLPLASLSLFFSSPFFPLPLSLFLARVAGRETKGIQLEREEVEKLREGKGREEKRERFRPSCWFPSSHRRRWRFLGNCIDCLRNDTVPEPVVERPEKGECRSLPCPIPPRADDARL